MAMKEGEWANYNLESKVGDRKFEETACERKGHKEASGE